MLIHGTWYGMTFMSIALVYWYHIIHSMIHTSFSRVGVPVPGLVSLFYKYGTLYVVWQVSRPTGRILAQHMVYVLYRKRI